MPGALVVENSTRIPAGLLGERIDLLLQIIMSLFFGGFTGFALRFQRLHSTLTQRLVRLRVGWVALRIWVIRRAKHRPDRSPTRVNPIACNPVTGCTGRLDVNMGFPSIADRGSARPRARLVVYLCSSERSSMRSESLLCHPCRITADLLCHCTTYDARLVVLAEAFSWRSAESPRGRLGCLWLSRDQETGNQSGSAALNDRHELTASR